MGWGREKVVVGVRLTFPAASKSMSPRGCYGKKEYEMRAGMEGRERWWCYVRLTFPAAAKSMPKTSLSPRGCYGKKRYEMRAGMEGQERWWCYVRLTFPAAAKSMPKTFLAPPPTTLRWPTPCHRTLALHARGTRCPLGMFSAKFR